MAYSPIVSSLFLVWTSRIQVRALTFTIVTKHYLVFSKIRSSEIKRWCFSDGTIMVTFGRRNVMFLSYYSLSWIFFQSLSLLIYSSHKIQNLTTVHRNTTGAFFITHFICTKSCCLVMPFILKSNSKNATRVLNLNLIIPFTCRCTLSRHGSWVGEDPGNGVGKQVHVTLQQICQMQYLVLREWICQVVHQRTTSPLIPVHRKVFTVSKPC